MQSLKELANKAAHAYSTRFSTYIESDPLGADQQHVWSFMFAITQPHKVSACMSRKLVKNFQACA